MGTTSENRPAQPRGEHRDNPPPVPYEPPRITVLGTVRELTLGTNTQAQTDGTFPGSMFG
jgi:hypothetical protein